MVAIFLSLLLILSFIWIKKCYKYWIDLGFVQAEAIFPFGSMSGVSSKLNFFEKCDEFYKQFKGKELAVGAYNFLSPMLILIDKNLIYDVMMREFETFPSRGLYFNRKQDPMMAK